MTLFEKIADEIRYNPDEKVLFSPIPGDPEARAVQMQAIQEDKDGNVRFYLYDLYKQVIARPIKKRADSTLSYEALYKTRLNDPINGAKYLYKKGSPVVPYFPFEIIEKFDQGDKIKTLVITEGEKKAYRAAKAGIDIVGIPGINIWKQKKDRHVFPQLKELVEKCDVKQIIFLHDADALQVNYDIPDNKDLFKRPNNFYQSVCSFKRMCLALNVDLYYKHIDTASPHKGLDDLLNSDHQEKDIIKDLMAIGEVAPSAYFSKTHTVSNISYNQIKKIFSITDVSEFYAAYHAEIREREFKYHRDIYQWNTQDEELEKIKSGIAASFVMIGNTIYQQGDKPNSREMQESVLIPVQKQIIDKQFGKKIAGEIWREMPYYNGAFVLPSHTNLQSTKFTTDKHGNKMKWYNLYHELNHEPAAGSCPVSLNFVRHIFGEETFMWRGREYNEFELGLDYIQILYMKPTQKLPILSLVSEERHTGKTAFWNWMRDIFGQNARFIRHEDLTRQFTSHFATSLLGIIDEALIEKKATMERIKALVTAETNTLEAKFQNPEEIENFLKIGISSNNRNFAIIESDEVRFWVREVQPVPEDQLDLHLRDKLIEEIPAFLHFLAHRKLHHNNPQNHRQWFHPGLIETNLLKEIKRNSRYKMEKDIEEFLKDHMSKVQRPYLEYGAKNLLSEIGDKKRSLSDYTDILELRMKKKKTAYSKKYKLYDYHNGQVTINEAKTRFYTFYAVELFEIEDIFEFLNEDDLIEADNKAMANKDNKHTLWHQLQRDPDKIWLIPICAHAKNKMPSFGKDIELVHFKQSKDLEQFITKVRSDWHTNFGDTYYNPINNKAEYETF